MMDRTHALGAVLLLAQFRMNQWKSRDELESMQEEKLRKLVSYASEHVPYYRKALTGKSVRDLDDLSSLPLLTKKNVRQHSRSLVSRRFDANSLIQLTTSGSTGTPLEIYHSPDESKYGPAFELHQMIEAGVGPFDVHAVITKERNQPGLLNRLGLLRRHCFEFRNSRQLAQDIRSIRPTVLRGTPSFIVPLAFENIRSGFGLHVKRAFTFSEVLTDKARDLIFRSFGCAVFDSYGSIETSWIGWECEKGSMHLFSDSIIAEVVDEKGNKLGQGRHGSIVLTPLWKRSMPLIRYNLGDRTALGSGCRCGRGYHVLKPVEGRNNDFIVLPSGAACSAHLIGFNIRSFPGILQFQARQENAGEIRLLIIPEAGMTDEVRRKIIKTLKGVFPEPMNISLELVSELPRSSSGKLCEFVSRLKTHY
jgi:phenylacetate-CoA ligase